MNPSDSLSKGATKKVKVIAHTDKGLELKEIEVDVLSEILYKLRPKLHDRKETGAERIKAVETAHTAISDLIKREVRNGRIELIYKIDDKFGGKYSDLYEYLASELAQLSNKTGGKDE